MSSYFILLNPQLLLFLSCYVNSKHPISLVMTPNGADKLLTHLLVVLFLAFYGINERNKTHTTILSLAIEAADTDARDVILNVL